MIKGVAATLGLCALPTISKTNDDTKLDTSNFYMPKEFETIAKAMISSADSKKKDRLVMDSLDEAKQVDYEHLDPNNQEDFIKISSMRYGRGPTKYGYWDMYTDKWVAKPEDSLWARLFQEMENGTFTTVEAVKKKYGIKG